MKFNFQYLLFGAMTLVLVVVIQYQNTTIVGQRLLIREMATNPSCMVGVPGR